MRELPWTSSGIAHDGNFFYWSHTVTLVKTDQQGQALIQVEVPSHHGDLTAVEDELYVAVELGMFNQPAGQSKPWIYLYDSDTLSLKKGAKASPNWCMDGGIAYHEGRFLLVGGLPPTHQDNYLFEYDKDLNFIQKHSLPTGYTRLGVQTIDYVDNHWWLGCYGSPDNPGFSRSTLLLNWYPIQRPTSVTVWLLQVGELMCFKDFASMIAPGETQPSGHLLDTLSIFFQPLTYLHGLLNFSRILTQDISSPASEELVVAKECFATKINHPTLDRIGS